MSKRLVKPRLISGFRDLSPEEMIAKLKMLATVKKVFQLFGFDPLDTATAHFKDVLFGADENADMDYFRMDNSRGKSTSKATALRFDLTVSLMRYIAANLDSVPRPFKRWQEGKVFRGEEPREGRFCEFTQLDADILFSADIRLTRKLLM